MEVFILPNIKEEIMVFYANRFFLRLRGLIGWILYETTGLLISPCSRVHTFFMQYPIDVVYLSKENTILHIDENLQPFRFGRKIKNTKKVLELKSGAAKTFDFKVGDQIILEKTNIVI